MLSETLHLGKHAFVVLASYGIGAVALGGLILQSIRAARKSRSELDALEGNRNG